MIDKLAKRVAAGDFYDAFQMYTSVYNRLTSEGKTGDAQALLLSGTQLLLQHNQVDSGGELAVMLTQHLISYDVPPSEGLTKSLLDVLQAFKYDCPHRDRYLAKLFKWSKLYSEHGHASFHKACADMYFSESNYSMCTSHCTYLDYDGITFYNNVLIQISHVTYPSEISLVITWAVLKFISMKRLEHARRIFKCYTMEHPNLSKDGFPFSEPLLNFCHFLILSLDRNNPGLVKLLKEKYQKCLQRDPVFYEFLEKILFVYFNESSQATSSNSFGGLSSLMGSLFGSPPPAAAAVDNPVAHQEVDLD